MEISSSWATERLNSKEIYNSANQFMDNLMLDFQSPDGSYVLTFEDDGKVAYAYLRKGGTIVGDVWLYNRCPTPQEPEWSDRSKIPFANSRAYVKGGSMLRSVGREDVLVDWDSDERGPLAYVYIFEDLYGVVGVGDKPGYARFATKDNPLAKVMVMEDSAP